MNGELLNDTDKSLDDSKDEFIESMPLLDRLKRIRELTEQTRATINTDHLPATSLESSSDLGHNVFVLEQKAKTAVLERQDLKSTEKYEIIDLINEITLVPDEELADMNKNEMNLTPYVRRFLPESEWPKYIPEPRLDS